MTCKSRHSCCRADKYLKAVHLQGIEACFDPFLILARTTIEKKTKPFAGKPFQNEKGAVTSICIYCIPVQRKKITQSLDPNILSISLGDMQGMSQ